MTPFRAASRWSSEVSCKHNVNGKPAYCEYLFSSSIPYTYKGHYKADSPPYKYDWDYVMYP